MEQPEGSGANDQDRGRGRKDPEPNTERKRRGSIAHKIAKSKGEYNPAAAGSERSMRKWTENRQEKR